MSVQVGCRIAVIAFFSLLLSACGSRQPQVASPVPVTTAASSKHEVRAELTAGEIQAARSGIAECWYRDPKAKLPPGTLIDVVVKLLPDETVQSAEIVDRARMMRDEDYRAAAEAARRAIVKCSPLRMPPAKYETWKSTIFQVDPLGMPG
jgi:hypothetical protein